MLKQSDLPILFLRYGLSRKKNFLRDFKVLYDGLTIPANILLYQYKGTPAIIYSTGQPFFVDPMSYLFGHRLDDFRKLLDKGTKKFKPSFAKLLQGYGEDPDYFLYSNYNSIIEYLLTINNQNRLGPFVKNCLDFQWANVNTTINESKDLLPEGENIELRPTILIPPYFAYRTYDQSFDLNSKILKHCNDYNALYNDTSIFPVIFIEKENLNDKFLTILLNSLEVDNFTGFCVWIANFDERDAKSSEIKSLIKLLEILSDNNRRQILMLYGGFFSLLLFKYGVTGISHGIAYSESKSIDAAIKQTGGGVPIRYYVPKLHQFLTIDNALLILRERPDLLCDCPICQRIVQSNIENITRFKDEEEFAEIHFLYNRNLERELVKTC
jgi:hypothetical protein